MAPQLYDGKVLISTIPGSSSNFYQGGAFGTVYSLNAKTGKTIWSFQTIKGGAKLFGNPKVNSGGGLWYPPSVDAHGRVFLSVANPAPLYGTPKFPNGSSRPGANLYTDSIVALDGQTGKLLWFRQAIRHDLRDYDLMIPAITATVPVQGVQTEVELVAGKMGKAYAYRADNGQHLWTRPVGKHQHDTGLLPRKPIDVFPGIFGGVETPMAFAGNRLFVPWLNFPTHASATGIAGGLGSFKAGTGGLTAIDAGTGKVLWQNKLPSINVGAATVANDVVFTSTYAGTIYAFDTKTGKTLWTTKAPAGINSFPAVTKDMLIVGAGAPGIPQEPAIPDRRLLAERTRRRCKDAGSTFLERPTRGGWQHRVAGERSWNGNSGQGWGVLLQALDQVAQEARQGDVCIQEHRPRLARLPHPRQDDATDPARPDDKARRHVREEGQVPLPLHGARACRGWDEGRLHGGQPRSATGTGRSKAAAEAEVQPHSPEQRR
jgi:hypothetical protein